MAPAVRLHLWASPGGHRGATLVKSASQRRATAAFRSEFGCFNGYLFVCVYVYVCMCMLAGIDRCLAGLLPPTHIYQNMYLYSPSPRRPRRTSLLVFRRRRSAAWWGDGRSRGRAAAAAAAGVIELGVHVHRCARVRMNEASNRNNGSALCVILVFVSTIPCFSYLFRLPPFPSEGIRPPNPTIEIVLPGLMLSPSFFLFSTHGQAEAPPTVIS